MRIGIFTVGLLFATFVTAQSGESPSVLAGAYTEAQAISGQALYYQHCLACHGEMMNGVDQAPPLAGPQFSNIWNGESLLSLVERIDTMPPDKAGTLSRQETVDILSYILWYNGLPLGDAALDTARDVLAGMTFETPPTGK
jgi:mono/diheme cytochrome c family protein